MVRTPTSGTQTRHIHSINVAYDAPRSGEDEEERVLSYGDVVLLRSDLAILRGPHFLNDRIIAFYLAHLSSFHGDGDLLRLPPSIPYLLSNLPDPASVAAVADPLRLASCRLVLLPVNDNPDVSFPEDASRPRFVHHDSLAGANLPAARRLATTLRPLLPAASVPLVEGPTPVQANSYDCGVYVLAVARAICNWWRDHKGETDWFEIGSRRCGRRRRWSDSVKAMRAELLHLIARLIKDKEEEEEKNKDN